jgi:hypothetical protein
MNIEPAELEKLLDRAARKGATEALERLGLRDEQAARDLQDMRDLLGAWRTTRQEIWRTTLRILTAGLLTFLAAAIWMNFKDKL